MQLLLFIKGCERGGRWARQRQLKTCKQAEKFRMFVATPWHFVTGAQKWKFLCIFLQITLLSSTINLPVPSLPTNILRLVYERGDILQNLLFKHLTSPHKPMYVPMVYGLASHIGHEYGRRSRHILPCPWVAMEHGHVTRLAEEKTWYIAAFVQHMSCVCYFAARMWACARMD